MLPKENVSPDKITDDAGCPAEIEATILAMGFSRVGSLDNGQLALDYELGRHFVGVYVMILDGRAFNIGESRSVRERLKSYDQWLRRSYPQNTERHLRETRAQDRWRALGGMGHIEVYVRRSDTISLFGVRVPLNKPEEAALIARFRPLVGRFGAKSVLAVADEAPR